MRRLILSACLLLSFTLSACAPLGGRGANDGRLAVVATFTVIADFVRQVGGEHVALTTLAGPGVDTHTFNPTAADGAALADAALVFENGANFEGWLDDLYASTGSRGVRVTLTDGIHLRTAEDGAAAQDPHVWHDVKNAMVMVRNVRDALVTADPAHRADYEANAKAYTAQLEDLDAWVVAQVASLPPERRKLVTTHDTFGYFAERYGFEVLGSVLPTSTEGASPSAQQLAALVKAVRAAGVPAIFAENVSSNSLLSQVANEAGVQVVGSLYTDALGPEGSGAETYIGMLRQNVTTLVTALEG
jgi:ABC-type Zn uptake system ZnuABC Zn-binding protein ZnuA